MTHDNRPSMGLFARIRQLFFGTRAAKLAEQERKKSFLAYVLMFAQGIALVLVFGHAQIQWVQEGKPALVVIVSLSLFLLISTAIAAQNCSMATLRRIGPLWSHSQMGAAIEHIAYVAFVAVLEGSTLLLAFYIIDVNPEALLNNGAIVPFGVIGIAATVGLRAVLIVWTEIQLQIVAQPLPPAWETWMAAGKELIGGHAQSILEGLSLSNSNLPAVSRAVAEMSKPPIRRKTWWNGALIRRDEEYARQLDIQAEKVAASLEAMTRNQVADLEQKLAEAEREAERKVAEVTERLQREMANRITSALLDVLAGNELEEWLVEAAPQLARFHGKGVAKVGTKARTFTERKLPTSPTEIGRAFLEQLELVPAKAKRGVWVNGATISALTDGAIDIDTARDLARRFGEGVKDGTALIAPLDLVIADLIERNKLSATALQTWQMLNPPEPVPLRA